MLMFVIRLTKGEQVSGICGRRANDLTQRRARLRVSPGRRRKKITLHERLSAHHRRRTPERSATAKAACALRSFRRLVDPTVDTQRTHTEFTMMASWWVRQTGC